jgi:hypothetical protein
LIAALKAQAGGSGDGKPNPQEVTNWSDEQLEEFLKGKYVAEDIPDFLAMPRKDAIEMLVEDEHVLDF